MGMVTQIQKGQIYLRRDHKTHLKLEEGKEEDNAAI